MSHVALAPGRLDAVSAAIETGVTAVLGASGSGKTSLLNLLAAFEEPSSGSIRRPDSLFWAPQDGGLWPGLTVREHLLAMTRDGEAIAAMLDALALDACAARAPEALSRGEQARLTVARALLSGASALVMDEPLAHIDSTRRSPFWKVIRESIAARGQSLVFATHEPELVLGEASQVLCVDSGRVVFHGCVKELYWHPGSPQLAGFLGPANWITDEDRTLWFPDAPAIMPRSLRPEQLLVEIADPSTAENPETVVTAVHFRGSHEEIELHHRPSGRSATFWHRPAAPALAQGTAVRLHVRTADAYGSEPDAAPCKAP